MPGPCCRAPEMFRTFPETFLERRVRKQGNSCTTQVLMHNEIYAQKCYAQKCIFHCFSVRAKMQLRRKSIHNECFSLRRAKCYAIRTCTAQPLPLCICTAHAQKLLSARALFAPAFSSQIRKMFGARRCRKQPSAAPRASPNTFETRLRCVNDEPGVADSLGGFAQKRKPHFSIP